VKTHILLFTDNVDQDSEQMKAYKEVAADFKGKVTLIKAAYCKFVLRLPFLNILFLWYMLFELELRFFKMCHI